MGAAREDLRSAGTRGMTVLMKTTRNKVLQFPKPPEESKTSPIVVQIGNERFAIHYRMEELPADTATAAVKAPRQKATAKIVKFPAARP